MDDNMMADLMFESPSDFDTDGVEVVHIDMDEIDSGSQADAEKTIQILTKLYCDDDFLNRNPRLKQRIDHELDSLRILNKMRRSDEKAHDSILSAISSNPTNASLYKALADVQKTTISLTTKINEIITSLYGVIKNYQTEINFDQEDDEEKGEDRDDGQQKQVFRGSKDFILSMAEKKETV